MPKHLIVGEHAQYELDTEKFAGLNFSCIKDDPAPKCAKVKIPSIPNAGGRTTKKPMEDAVAFFSGRPKRAVHA